MTHCITSTNISNQKFFPTQLQADTGKKSIIHHPSDPAGMKKKMKLT